MKKLTLLLVLSLLISCSESENSSIQQRTTDVVALVNQPQSSRSSSVDVNRGNIYDWVSEIDISLTQTETNYNKSQNFVLVNQGGEDNFRVEEIAIGPNEIYAETKTDSQERFDAKAIENGRGGINEEMDNYRAVKPYVLYTSEPFTQEIQDSGTNVVNIQLNTNNGRIYSSVKWANNAVYRTEGYAMISYSNSQGQVTTEYRLNKDGVVYNYWSNKEAVEGEVMTLTAKIYANSGVLVETFTREVEVRGSTSLRCNYIITDDELFGESTIVLTFEEWLEDVCTGC